VINLDDIQWSGYLEYEGPFFPGNVRFHLPENPSEAARMLAVITATEGGSPNAYNGYDSCDCTLGLIQWCDGGQFSVCDMLGHTAERDRSLIRPIYERCEELENVTFRRNSRGRWRFFFDDERGEVDRRREQDQLYHLHSTGKRGSWDPASRVHAQKWARAMASVYEHDDAIQAQMDFTKKRLEWFVADGAMPIFEGAPETDVGRAFRAAYLSFAANNPTWAQRHLLRADSDARLERYSAGWLIEVLRSMTFGPKVAIYPERYEAIRPVLERMYGVELPDMADTLSEWEGQFGSPLPIRRVQAILSSLRYDLGPSGVDGVDGPKTRAAVSAFQSAMGLEPTGHVFPATRDALLAAEDAADAAEGQRKDGRRWRERVTGLVGTTLSRMAQEAIAEEREKWKPISSS